MEDLTENQMNLERADKLKNELWRPAINLLEGKKDLLICEIGVQYGINSKDMLERFDIKKLYLVDPYINCYEIKEFAKEYLKEYNDKIEWIENCSWDAVDFVPNNLDLVYIDGDHRYFAVRLDLIKYYPKVKNGGVFAGHDFVVEFDEEKNEYLARAPGVIKAVMEFFEILSKEKKQKLHISNQNWDWWYIKEA